MLSRQLTHVVNIVCCTTYTTIGGASGLGLIMSICTGYTLEKFSDAPLTQSTSPSDFWGNRWDRPVESTLRRGCFRPLRKASYSRNLAAFGTFVVSGIIHEYMLWVMSFRRGPPNNPQGVPYVPVVGNQFLFFLWNGIVLVLERWWTGHQVLQWMQRHLPKPVRTALVLLTVLPIAHLFADEYIRSCFLGDAV